MYMESDGIGLEDNGMHSDAGLMGLGQQIHQQMHPQMAALAISTMNTVNTLPPSSQLHTQPHNYGLGGHSSRLHGAPSVVSSQPHAMPSVQNAHITASHADSGRLGYISTPQYTTSASFTSPFYLQNYAGSPWPAFQHLPYIYSAPYGCSYPTSYPYPSSQAQDSKIDGLADTSLKMSKKDNIISLDGEVELYPKASSRKKRIYTKQLICSVCQNLKLRVYKYLGATEAFCNACNQHWQRNNHTCPICTKIDNLLGVHSVEQRHSIKESRKSKVQQGFPC